MVSGYILMLVIVKLTSGKVVSVFSQELWGCLVPTALSECAVITILFYYPQADRWEWYQNILIYISIEHPFIGFRAIFSIFVVLFTKGLWASLGAQLVKNPPAMQEILVWLLGHEDPLCSSPTPVFLGFPGGSAGEESTHNAGDLGSTPGLGRSPGEGKGYPLQYSGLEYSCIWRIADGHDWATLTFTFTKGLYCLRTVLLSFGLLG